MFFFFVMHGLQTNNKGFGNEHASSSLRERVFFRIGIGWIFRHEESLASTISWSGTPSRATGQE